MQKRNKHILINLTDDQFTCLKFIAEKQRRKISDAAYLLLIDSININILPLVDAGATVKPLNYNNDK